MVQLMKRARTATTALNGARVSDKVLVGLCGPLWRATLAQEVQSRRGRWSRRQPTLTRPRGPPFGSQTSPLALLLHTGTATLMPPQPTDIELTALPRATTRPDSTLSRSSSTDKLSRVSTFANLPDLTSTPPPELALDTGLTRPSSPSSEEVGHRLRRLSGNEREGAGLELPPVDGGKGAWGFVVAGFILECVQCAHRRVTTAPLTSSPRGPAGLLVRSRPFLLGFSRPLRPEGGELTLGTSLSLGLQLFVRLDPGVALVTRALVQLVARGPHLDWHLAPRCHVHLPVSLQASGVSAPEDATLKTRWHAASLSSPSSGGTPTGSGPCSGRAHSSTASACSSRAGPARCAALCPVDLCQARLTDPRAGLGARRCGTLSSSSVSSAACLARSSTRPSSSGSTRAPSRPCCRSRENCPSARPATSHPH